MPPIDRKASVPLGLLALATLACLCGPIARLQSTAATAQAVATDVGGGVATFEAVNTAIIGTEQAVAAPIATGVPPFSATFGANLEELRPTLIASDLDETRQWAITAMSTSQLSAPDYSAAQTTGRPNTPTCGQAPTAWASQDPTSPEEEITLTYAQPVIAYQVNIYESFNPGFVTQVRLVDVFGDTPIIYQAAPQLASECPRILTINVAPGVERSAAVVITLDQTNAPSWSQIDAVELVGLR